MTSTHTHTHNKFEIPNQNAPKYKQWLFLSGGIIGHFYFFLHFAYFLNFIYKYIFLKSVKKFLIKVNGPLLL